MNFMLSNSDRTPRSELFSIPENKLIGYADASTLMAVVPSPMAVHIHDF